MVFGAKDPAAPAALLAYAHEAETLGFDPVYVADVRRMAGEFAAYCAMNGRGDPDAPPHRKDDPATLAKMRSTSKSAMMKIKTNTYGRNTGYEVESWVDSVLSDARHDGSAERAQDVAYGCAAAIGRLVAVLAEKGILTAPEVHRVAMGYHDDSATFDA